MRDDGYRTQTAVGRFPGRRVENVVVLNAVFVKEFLVIARGGKTPIPRKGEGAGSRGAGNERRLYRNQPRFAVRFGADGLDVAAEVDKNRCARIDTDFFNRIRSESFADGAEIADEDLGNYFGIYYADLVLTIDGEVIPLA